MNNIINKIKKETNNLDNIIYRKKRILFKDIYIIYIDALISSDKIIVSELKANTLPQAKNKIEIKKNLKKAFIIPTPILTLYYHI